jgi:hypothetical protein
MMKIEGSVFASGSISQRHGSADPDPHQNVMDPQHWLCRSGTYINVLYAQNCTGSILVICICRGLLWAVNNFLLFADVL